MTAAAQTSGLTNPPTGENRLFDVARWLVTILLVHFIIARGRRLTAGLNKPYGPDDAFLAHHFGTTDRGHILARLTRALCRAAALEDELRACRPTEQGFSIEARSVVAAQIVDICRALGLLPAKPALARAKTAHLRIYSVASDLPDITAAPTTIPQPIATGPPSCHCERRLARSNLHRSFTRQKRVYPWSLSRRTPASVLLTSI